MKIMPVYINQQLAIDNQKCYKKNINKTSFNARNYNELIRESIALKIGGRFATETFEELAEAAGTPCCIPKQIAKRMRQLKHNKTFTTEISENLATTASSKNMVEIFKEDVENFREVEPSLIYAGHKIPEKTIEKLAEQKFKYVINLENFDDSEYAEALSNAGIRYINYTSDGADRFKQTIEKALKNNERVYFHCSWGTTLTDAHILVYNVIFKRILPKKLAQELEYHSDLAGSTIMLAETYNPTYSWEKLDKILNYMKNPDTLTKDLNLDVDI